MKTWIKLTSVLLFFAAFYGTIIFLLIQNPWIMVGSGICILATNLLLIMGSDENE
ncbi:MAG: hypothetical protein ACTSUI_00610 [Promethearchaeota archaeon]